MLSILLMAAAISVAQAEKALSLTISADKAAEAIVTKDGMEWKGPTPLKIEPAPSGAYKVRLRNDQLKLGYEDTIEIEGRSLIRQVQLVPLETIEELRRRKPLPQGDPGYISESGARYDNNAPKPTGPASLKISTPIVIEIVVTGPGGTWRGPTPLTIDPIPPGRYQVLQTPVGVAAPLGQCEVEPHRRYDATMGRPDLVPARVATADLPHLDSLIRPGDGKTGWLTLIPTPSAEAAIVVDGKIWKAQAPARRVPASVGEYEVRFDNPTLGVRAVSRATVKPGEETFVELILKPVD